MMMSWHGNIFHVTGHLWEQSADGFRSWRSSNTELWCFLWFMPKQRVELLVIQPAIGYAYVMSKWWLVVDGHHSTHVVARGCSYLGLPMSSRWLHLILIEANWGQAISMGQCKKDVTPLLSHWSYVFLALTHRSGQYKKDVTPMLTHWSYVFLTLTHRSATTMLTQLWITPHWLIMPHICSNPAITQCFGDVPRLATPWSLC